MKYKRILLLIFVLGCLVVFVSFYFSEKRQMQRKRDTWNKRIKEAMSDISLHCTFCTEKARWESRFRAPDWFNINLCKCFANSKC